MSLFQVVGERLDDHAQATFWVDNLTLKVTQEKPDQETAVQPVAKIPAPKGELPIQRIKIQMGLECNYSCSYCSQAAVTRPESMTARDIEPFIQMLTSTDVNLHPNVRFEFWGGEPFVYWKTLKPLAERLREIFPRAQFNIITNGSLLDVEKVDWLAKLGFGMNISHDGPGQHMRGDDPLDTKYEIIRYALEKLEGRIAMSSVLNKQNTSRAAIIDFWISKFPELNIKSQEMAFLDVYNEGGTDSLELTVQDVFDIRRNLWAELRFISRVREHCHEQSYKCEEVLRANTAPNNDHECQGDGCCCSSGEGGDGCTGGCANHAPAVQFGQKCGMEDPATMAVDLKGNVLTCQNVSAAETAANGNSHAIGHLSDLSGVVLNTHTHWTSRDNCPTCPVVKICQGSCMFLQGSNFRSSCEMSFTEALTQFAIGFEQLTGYIPVRIIQDGLPKNRQDLWGTLERWDSDQAPRIPGLPNRRDVQTKIKQIPIKVVG